MSQYRFAIEIDVEAPMLSQSAESRRLGLDAIALTAADGRLAVPGALVRGNLRHILRWLRDRKLLSDPDLLFGPLGEADSRRSEIIFDHAFVAADEPSAPVAHHRIKIGAGGVVEEGALLQAETQFASGKTVTLTGGCLVELPNDESAALFRRQLLDALRLVPAIGAYKSVGFGRVLDARVDYSERAIATPDDDGPANGDALVFGLQLRFDRPLCFSRRPPQSNRFESLDHVPGGALKGALMAYVKAHQGDADCALIEQCAETIGFTHARSGLAQPNAQKFHVAPLSWAFCDQELIDLALISSVEQLSEARLKEGIRFSADWKKRDESAVATYLDAITPARCLSLHTEINAETGGSQEEALFAYECIETEVADWRCSLSIQMKELSERQALDRALRRVLPRALLPLGKTDAIAEVAVYQEVPAFTLPSLNRARKLILILQSDALIHADFHGIPGTGGGRKLHAAYTDAWRALSGKSLKLSHYFARQRLVGGPYLHNRFVRDRPYNPLVLTEAGSVFVFDIEDAEAALKTVNDWLKFGIPQPDAPDWARDWRRNPYQRENGYGEIRAFQEAPSAWPPLEPPHGEAGK